MGWVVSRTARQRPGDHPQFNQLAPVPYPQRLEPFLVEGLCQLLRLFRVKDLQRRLVIREYLLECREETCRPQSSDTAVTTTSSITLLANCVAIGQQPSAVVLKKETLLVSIH